MARLIPEVIAEGDVAHGFFPAPLNFKIFVQMQITAGGLALGIAKKGDNDLVTYFYPDCEATLTNIQLPRHERM